MAYGIYTGQYTSQAHHGGLVGDLSPWLAVGSTLQPVDVLPQTAAAADDETHAVNMDDPVAEEE